MATLQFEILSLMLTCKNLQGRLTTQETTYWEDLEERGKCGWKIIHQLYYLSLIQCKELFYSPLFPRKLRLTHLTVVSCNHICYFIHVMNTTVLTLQFIYALNSHIAYTLRAVSIFSKTEFNLNFYLMFSVLLFSMILC